MIIDVGVAEHNRAKRITKIIVKALEEAGHDVVEFYRAGHYGHTIEVLPSPDRTRLLRKTERRDKKEADHG